MRKWEKEGIRASCKSPFLKIRPLIMIKMKMIIIMVVMIMIPVMMLQRK